jgi:signal transduction histidine kinase
VWSRLVWLLPVTASMGFVAAAASVSREQDHALGEVQRMTQSHAESVVRLVTASTALAMQAYAEARDDLEDRLVAESDRWLDCDARCREAADPWLVVRLRGRPELEGEWGTDDADERARLRTLAAGPERLVDLVLGGRSHACLILSTRTTDGICCADASALAERRRKLGPGAALREIEKEDIRYVAMLDQGGLLAASPSARTLDGFDEFLANVLSAGKLQYRERHFADRDLVEGASAIPLPDGSTAVLRVGIDARPLVVARARRDRWRTALVAIPGLLSLLAFTATWALERRRRLRLQLAALTAEHAREEERWAEIARMAAMTAHEVRNPLSTVRMAAQRIMIEQSDAEVSDVARVIVDQVDRLDRVLGDFVLLSRPFAIVPERVQLPAVVSAVAEPLAVRAAAEGKRLVVEVAPIEVRVDASRVGQALRNLVENALDSVAQGGTVWVTGGPDGSWLRLEVLDDGPGMSEAECAASLDLFYTTKSFGTGLGLPIARRIAEGHGGEMILSPRREGGLRVTLRLPAEVPVA